MPDNNENPLPDSWEGKCVLVAEDVDLNYKLIELLLTKFKVNCIRAENGLIAVETVKATTGIDLVFMDIRMPVIRWL